MSIKKIHEQLEHLADQGALRYRGVRYLLLRPETLATFQAALETEVGPERAGKLLYEGGFTGGRLSGRRYRDTLGLSDREAVTFMCRMGGELGWGRFRLRELDLPAVRLVVEVDASPFAEAYRSPAEAEDGNDDHNASAASGPGVCHLIRGVLGGLVAGLCDAAVEARETACLARGAAACRFEVTAPP